MSVPVETIVNVVTRSSCSNCGQHHPPKSCPAYKDRCLACRCMGHWKKLCRKGRHIPDSRFDQPTANIKENKETKSKGRKGRCETKTHKQDRRRNTKCQNVVRFHPDSDTDSESENYNTYTKIHPEKRHVSQCCPLRISFRYSGDISG